MLYFKLPFNKKIYTTDDTTNSSLVSFHQFSGGKTLRFPGNLTAIPKEEFLKTTIETSNIVENLQEETKQEYTDRLRQVILFIKENQLPKLVISRKKIIDYPELNFNKSFLQLCKKYPNALVYLFKNNEEIWMGAFSELLGKFNKKTAEFETMSLAGTLPIAEEWTKKEIEEQQPVSDYIQEVLLRFSDQVKISPTYDHISGNIKHLRTDFKTNISPENLDKLISELHPTPAVCGIPKDFCKAAIKKFEQYNREFYSGFSRIETETEVFYFVNLRCGKFYKNTAKLFVGGGITKNSNPEKEWRETELKAEALTKNLKIF